MLLPHNGSQMADYHCCGQEQVEYEGQVKDSVHRDPDQDYENSRWDDCLPFEFLKGSASYRDSQMHDDEHGSTNSEGTELGYAQENLMLENPNYGYEDSAHAGLNYNCKNSDYRE